MAVSDLRIESAFYERTSDGYVCGLCPHRCRIPVGGTGRCGSRRGEEDMLTAGNYGKVTSLCVDPIEKKPLYHYRPKTDCFSIGGVGCNMKCLHCQNYAISSSRAGSKRATFETPEEIAAMCRREGLDTIAFTYNEPSIWFEFIRDVAKAMPEADIVLVTNGLVCEEPLRELCGISDAMNIDVKGFTEDFYRKVCGAELSDVMRSCEVVREEGVHLEITYLVIPGYNDTPDEIDAFCDWVRDSLSPDTPVHFNRFHPDNRMTDVPWTPVETVVGFRERAMSRGLEFVYAGNVITDGGADTVCPDCGATAVRRMGYTVDVCGLDGSRCASCGRELNIRLRGRTPGSPV